MGNGCIQLTRGGPEITYLLQEGMSWMESLKLNPPVSPSRYLIGLEDSVVIMILKWDVLVTCSKSGTWYGVLVLFFGFFFFKILYFHNGSQHKLLAHSANVQATNACSAAEGNMLVSCLKSE